MSFSPERFLSATSANPPPLPRGHKSLLPSSHAATIGPLLASAAPTTTLPVRRLPGPLDTLPRASCAKRRLIVLVKPEAACALIRRYLTPGEDLSRTSAEPSPPSHPAPPLQPRQRLGKWFVDNQTGLRRNRTDSLYVEGFQEGSYLSYPSLILIFKSDLLIKSRRGESRARNAHPAGEPDGVFPRALISCKRLWLKEAGRGPRRGRGFGWVPFPFPHQTTMQPSETSCGRAPFSFSHPPVARPAEIVFCR